MSDDPMSGEGSSPSLTTRRTKTVETPLGLDDAIEMMRVELGNDRRLVQEDPDIPIEDKVAFSQTTFVWDLARVRDLSSWDHTTAEYTFVREDDA